MSKTFKISFFANFDKQIFIFFWMTTWWCTYEEGEDVGVGQDYFGEGFASDSYFENLSLMICSCMVLRISQSKFEKHRNNALIPV